MPTDRLVVITGSDGIDYQELYRLTWGVEHPAREFMVMPPEAMKILDPLEFPQPKFEPTNRAARRRAAALARKS
jgi:hypothetical protein